MRRCFVALVAALAASGVFAADANEDTAKRPTSPKAKSAIRDYDDAVAKATEAFQQEVGAARKKLLADLDEAQKRATLADVLDEALAIREFKKKIESEEAAVRPDDSGAGPAKGAQPGRLTVVAAFYGQNVSWLDVTAKLRARANGRAKWSTTVNTKDWVRGRYWSDTPPAIKSATSRRTKARN
jgi:hypothetical protein